MIISIKSRERYEVLNTKYALRNIEKYFKNKKNRQISQTSVELSSMRFRAAVRL